MQDHRIYNHEDYFICPPVLTPTMALRSTWTQWFPSEEPRLTEKNLPRQDGKVFIVTGGNSGIGFELIKILYAAGAIVYMAARSRERAEEAISEIQAIPVEQPGALKFLHLDLNDLSTIKASAAVFAAQEPKLDVLWNNAGVGGLPTGSYTKEGIEQQLGVNCIAPLLFTQLLLPQLCAAAATSPSGSVRIVWTSSWMAESMSPRGGIDFSELPQGSKNSNRNYGASKVGNWLLAVEGARRFGGQGIVSVVQNPGNLKTNVWRHRPKIAMVFLNLLLYKTIYGAYTELYAGLSTEITPDDNGAYVVPWGKIQRDTPRKDIIQAMKPEKDGGTDLAKKFWDFCESQAKKYA